LTIARLPKYLKQNRKKLYALTIDHNRLHQIRKERRPDSSYASLSLCKLETKNAEELFQAERTPFMDITDMSIEEISSRVLEHTHLKRKMI